MLDMFKSINHHGNNLLASNPDESSASDTNGVMFHQGDSLSGTTIQMYTWSPQPSQGYIPVVTRIQTTTKVGNPFDV